MSRSRYMNQGLFDWLIDSNGLNIFQLTTTEKNESDETWWLTILPPAPPHVPWAGRPSVPAGYFCCVRSSCSSRRGKSIEATGLPRLQPAPSPPSKTLRCRCCHHSRHPSRCWWSCPSQCWSSLHPSVSPSTRSWRRPGRRVPLPERTGRSEHPSRCPLSWRTCWDGRCRHINPDWNTSPQDKLQHTDTAKKEADKTTRRLSTTRGEQVARYLLVCSFSTWYTCLHLMKKSTFEEVIHCRKRWWSIGAKRQVKGASKQRKTST